MSLNFIMLSFRFAIPILSHQWKRMDKLAVKLRAHWKDKKKGNVFHLKDTWDPFSFSTRNRQIYYCQTWLKHETWSVLSILHIPSLLIRTVPTGAASCTSTLQAPFKTTFIFPSQKIRQSLWWKALTVAVSAERSWLDHGPFPFICFWSGEGWEDPLWALCVSVRMCTSWSPCHVLLSLVYWTEAVEAAAHLSRQPILKWVLELQKNMRSPSCGILQFYRCHLPFPLVNSFHCPFQCFQCKGCGSPFRLSTLTWKKGLFHHV